MISVYVVLLTYPIISMVIHKTEKSVTTVWLWIWSEFNPNFRCDIVRHMYVNAHVKVWSTGFRSSGVWCCVFGWVAPAVWKEHSAFETPSLGLLLLMYICIFQPVNMMPLSNWYSALKLCSHGWCIWQMWQLTVHWRRSQVNNCHTASTSGFT
jgi:hypothetical protein